MRGARRKMLRLRKTTRLRYGYFLGDSSEDLSIYCFDSHYQAS